MVHSLNKCALLGILSRKNGPIVCSQAGAFWGGKGRKSEEEGSSEYEIEENVDEIRRIKDQVHARG